MKAIFFLSLFCIPIVYAAQIGIFPANVTLTDAAGSITFYLLNGENQSIPFQLYGEGLEFFPQQGIVLPESKQQVHARILNEKASKIVIELQGEKNEEMQVTQRFVLPLTYQKKANPLSGMWLLEIAGIILFLGLLGFPLVSVIKAHCEKEPATPAPNAGKVYKDPSKNKCILVEKKPNRKTWSPLTVFSAGSEKNPKGKE
ncbi:hypothetical protein HZB00_01025 [Candidatus Woesearchaeota archaeon]|nr:hypothetical protein [Candidatus Woesearchaeota archaeon]